MSRFVCAISRNVQTSVLKLIFTFSHSSSLCLLLALSAVVARGFYLPGVAPYRYTIVSLPFVTRSNV
jgi:hypothetical protein